ncbi:MAG TPA: PAS domain S-box protein, partial [Sunxiuqinia sp.]|nr:PAS domain S-box protein [Sunxiuqinia sp.]
MEYKDKKQSKTTPEASQKESDSQNIDLPQGFNEDQNPEAIVRFDTERKHIYCSENLTTLLHADQKVVIGKTLIEAGYLHELSEEIDRMLDLTIMSGKRFFKEYSFFNGRKLFWLSIGLTPEKNAENETISVTGTIRDLNIQKEIEQNFSEKRQRYQLTAEASDFGVWDWVVGREDLHLSRKWKLQLGYYPDELEDKYSTWMDMLHPDDFNRVKRTFENFLKSSSLVYESEFRLNHRDGTYRWFKSRAAAIRNAEGEAIRVLGTNRDITAEKKAQSDFRMLHQAIMQSPVPIVITDLEGYIELFNPAFCNITGYSKEELLGKKTNIQKSGYHPQSYYKQLWDTILSGNEWVGEFKNRNKSGNVYWELASISSLKNEHGVITNYLKISEDISSQKKMEEELKRSKKRTQIESRSRTSFMANMSHEIRTPINGIIGFSELLKSGGLTPEQQIHYADIIEESSRYLLMLIDDIIDISKIEASELKLKKDACSLSNTFKDLSEQFQHMKEQKKKDHLDIRFRRPKLQHHDYIFTDTRRVKQILMNLFDNALKYTEQGYVEVGYQLLTKNKIQFYVEDTGSGIPKK